MFLKFAFTNLSTNIDIVIIFIIRLMCVSACHNGVLLVQVVILLILDTVLSSFFFFGSLINFFVCRMR